MSSERGGQSEARLFTIGHARHTLERFFSLLHGHSIQVVVDVRAKPSSRPARHFNKAELQQALAARGINYLYLGKDLGANPADVTDDNLRAAREHAYAAALERVLDLSRRAKVALLGAEEDPAGCHRYALLAPDLEARSEGGQVWHLRGNGKLEDDEAVQRRQEPQLSLL
ncbi:MAG: DUF488 domain-containing protein [Deltaproteobacteria bacterium]|nr:DUF488 domain-containing protein [Deltaproteobacteria bacterium]